MSVKNDLFFVILKFRLYADLGYIKLRVRNKKEKKMCRSGGISKKRITIECNLRAVGISEPNYFFNNIMQFSHPFYPLRVCDGMTNRQECCKDDK